MKKQQHRNNKLLTVSLSPAATEAIDILKEHYEENKTSRLMDTVVKAHMNTLGYQEREENTMESVTVQLISSGKQITRHASDGQTYFEAPESGDYIIRIRNNSYERKEVVVSVDGLSVMDGESASFETRGYILSAYSSIDIKGWRRTDNDVAAFKFTKTEESYSAKAGKGTDNVGVIGVAVFNEKVDKQYWAQPFNHGLLGGGKVGDGNLYRSLGGGTAGSPSTYNARTISSSNSRRISKSTGKSEVSAESAQYNIGTGYGKEAQMKVTSTTFTRDSLGNPNFITSMRYASRPTLIKWGVIAEPAQSPDPFPGNKIACKAPPGWGS